MGKRDQLRAVAHGTASAFASRNNDLGGYWAIGKLCRHAVESGTLVISFDLLEREVTPEWRDADAICARGATRFAVHVERLGLPLSAIRGAVVDLRFEPSDDPSLVRYRCAARIVDDRERAHEAVVCGVCWPHDPSMELRSTRVS